MNSSTFLRAHAHLPLVGLAMASLSLAALAQRTTVYVDTTADTPDASPGDGVAADAGGRTSLRAAIQEANASWPRATIVLAPGRHYRLTRAGAGEDLGVTGDLDVTAELHIDGRGARIDADGLDRAIDVRSGALLTAHRLGLTGGAVMDESGGALRVLGSAELSSCTILESDASGTGASGGGIAVDGGRLWMRDSEICACAAARAGGAIESVGADVEIHDCEFEDNFAGAIPGNGGAIHVTGAGTTVVEDSEFHDNVAIREGGALWNSATGTMHVRGTDIEGNSAEGSGADDGGGGLFNDGGMLVVEDCEIAGNNAVFGSGSGGGVFNLGGELRISASRLVDNMAARAGGGVEARDGSSILDEVWLARNLAGPRPGNGGGLHLTGAGDVIVRHSSVFGNVAASEGGGLWNSGNGRMRVLGCDLFANEAMGDAADQGGGALFNAGGQLVVQDCHLEANRASGNAGSGGGLLNDDGAIAVTYTCFVDNTARRAGGGVEVRGGQSYLSDVHLTGNVARPAPGNGGGLHVTGAGLVLMAFSMVDANDAGNEGGGLWNSSTGILAAFGVAMGGNSAPTGPDAFNDGGLFLLNGRFVTGGL